MKVAWQQMHRATRYLPAGAQRYIWTYVVISCLLSILDIVALMLLGLSLASMMSGADVNIPLMGKIEPRNYVWLLVGVSLLVLLKSALSLLQQWFATRKFAEFEMSLGRELFDAYIRAPWVNRLSRTTSELVRMVDVGIASVINSLVLPLMAVPAMVVSAVAIIGTLLIIQPLTAVISIVYLGAIALLLSQVLTKRTVEAGRVNRGYGFKVASLMTDMVGALKEVTLRDKMPEIAEVIDQNRRHATRARSNIRFLGSVPKFVMDTALIGGFLLVGTTSYLIEGSLDEAISAVVLFAVAGMRLVPTITSFQTTSNNLNANRVQVDAVLADIQDAEGYRRAAEELGKIPLEKEPKDLVLDNVSFTYPTGEQPAVANVSLTIHMGSSVGFVGESGSGKTTLIDMLLGLLIPQEGKILLDEQNLNDVMAAWRNRVGYVPQEVSLFGGTIAQNVALSWNDDIDEEKVISCLKRAQLWETVKARPGKLNEKVSERGMSFSGGQKQRLGIARALYTDPYVLILDEATSALDTKTESKVAKAIAGLRGEVTLISVAHRLSTVKDVDELFFMEDAHLLAHGTFDEVVAEVPKFQEQAALSGLLHD